MKLVHLLNFEETLSVFVLDSDLEARDIEARAWQEVVTRCSPWHSSKTIL